MSENPRILIVDDDKTVAHFITRILEQKSFDVIQATSGEDALAVLENDSKPIDVILLDIMLPRLTGFEVLDIIKANPNTTDIKAIMITTMTHVEDKVRAFAAGASDYLVKPFDSEELIARVETQVKVTQAERKVRESEQRFKDICDLLPQTVFEIDLNGQFTYCNRFGFESTGYAQEDIDGGTHALDLFIPEDRNRVAENILRVMTGEPFDGHEYTILRKDGSTYSALLYTTRIVHDGHVDGMRGIVLDITNIKQIEEALKQSEKRFRTLYESMNEGLCLHEVIYDETGDAIDYRILDVNPRYESILGLNKEDIIGKLASEAYNTGEPPYLDSSYAEVADSGKPFELETYFPPIDKHFSISAFSPEKGKFATVFTDITERKRTEQELRRQKEYFRSITENASDAICVINETGQLCYRSPSYKHVMGYDDDEIITDPLAHVHPEDKEKSLKNLTALFSESGHVMRMELRVKHKNRDWQWIEITVANRLHDPVVNGIVANFRDITERKQAEAALQESEARYRDLFENATDLIQSVDLNGKIIYVNESWKNTLGYADVDLIDLTIFDIISQDHLRECQNILQRVLQGEKVSGVETSFVAKNGQEIQVEGNINCKFKDGQPVATIGIFRDSTKRKQTAEETIASKKRLEGILDNMIDGVMIGDMQGKLTYVNDAICLQTKFPKEELLSKTAADSFVASEYMPKFVEHIGRMFSGESIEAAIYLMQRKDGSTFLASVNLSILRDAEGKPEATIAVSRDITKETEAEAEILRAKDRLNAIINSATGFYIATADLEGNITSWNKGAELIMGYNDEETVDKMNISQMFSEEVEHSGFMNMAVGELIEKGSFEGELQFIRKNRESFPAYLSTTILRDEEYRVMGMLAIVQDVTDKNRAEEEREQMQREMVDISRRAGMAEVATGVLHNVGNVLNSVNVSATLINDRVHHSKVGGLAKALALMVEHKDNLADFLTKDSKGKQLPLYLEKLSQALVEEQTSTLRETGELIKNIDHIKEIVSLQQSHARVAGVVESFSLADLVEDAVTINAGAIEQLNIEVLRDYAEVAPLATEKHKVLQIITNLVTNARHALRDSSNPDKTMRLRVASDEGDLLVMEIEDNGVGIPMENLEKIFAHGFTTKQDGHGFGLHSSALAAKQLGGALLASSDGAGKGATFTLELPYKMREEN